MALTRARVVRRQEVSEPRTLDVGGVGRRGRMRAEEHLALEAAKAARAAAFADAEAIRSAARAEAAEVSRVAEREGQERAAAQWAASFLALAAREQAAAAAEVERAVVLAQVIAERLVGARLAASPDLVADLARTALAEATGARAIRIDAHPLDVEVLRGHIAGSFPHASVTISPDSALERGSLLLSTDVGTLDAKLRTRIDRLAAALAAALRS